MANARVVCFANFVQCSSFWLLLTRIYVVHMLLKSYSLSNSRFLLFSVVNHLCDCRPYLHVLNLFLLALVQYFWTILVFSLAVTLCLFPDIGVSKENIFRWEIDIPVVSKLQKNVCPETLLIFWTLLLLCSVFVLLGEWLEGISTCRTREKNS